MSGFVDVHSHVVPSGDDGARTIEDGLELCRLALEAGTEILFATPHAHAVRAAATARTIMLLRDIGYTPVRNIGYTPTTRPRRAAKASSRRICCEGI